jgi:hypothetical protein
MLPAAVVRAQDSPGFVLLQTGMASSLIRNSVALMRNLPAGVLKVVHYLPVGSNEIEDRLLSLEAKLAELSTTPLDRRPAFLRRVLEACVKGSNLFPRRRVGSHASRRRPGLFRRFRL